jgi:hypothetical protein
MRVAQPHYLQQIIPLPLVIITAKTLQEENYSAKILHINSFMLLGSVIDEEDGEVRE